MVFNTALQMYPCKDPSAVVNKSKSITYQYGEKEIRNAITRDNNHNREVMQIKSKNADAHIYREYYGNEYQQFV